MSTTRDANTASSSVPCDSANTARGHQSSTTDCRLREQQVTFTSHKLEKARTAAGVRVVMEGEGGDGG
jgi:hypothetical protein